MFFPTEKLPVFVSIIGRARDGDFEAQMVFTRTGDEIHCATQNLSHGKVLSGQYTLEGYADLLHELAETFDITFHCPYNGATLQYH